MRNSSKLNLKNTMERSLRRRESRSICEVYKIPTPKVRNTSWRGERETQKQPLLQDSLLTKAKRQNSPWYRRNAEKKWRWKAKNLQVQEETRKLTNVTNLRQSRTSIVIQRCLYQHMLVVAWGIRVFRYRFKGWSSCNHISRIPPLFQYNWGLQ
jgi:hypothetical protein